MNRFEEYRDISKWLLDAAESDRGIEILFSEDEKKRISYRELASRCGKLHGFIRGSGVKRQDYILLYCSELENQLYGFWTCVLGGYVAVMISYNPHEPLEEAFVKKYGFAGIITDLELSHPEWFDLIVRLPDIDWDSMEECETGEPLDVDREELLYVQFSSGTTGEGKAIPVKRKNLFVSLYDEFKCFNVTDEDIILNWHPITHSGGLVIYHMLGMYAGLPQYLIPTGTYLKNPLFWAEMVSRCGATITGEIPFAIQHFLRFLNNSKKRFEWDLSRLRIIGIGAENVNWEFLGKFYDALKEYGLSREVLSPIYGLSEATCLLAFSLGASYTYRPMRQSVSYGERVVRSQDDSPSLQEYIPYTKLSEHMEVRITDDGFNTLSDNEIGRMWIKGPAVVDGYLSDGQLIRTEQFRDGWFDTGDLGALTDKGELVIVGRTKEIVVSGGANFECAALEKCIGKIDAGDMIQGAFVSNIPDKDGIEQIVVFCESDKMAAAGFEGFFADYVRRVRSELFETFGVTAGEVVPIEKAPRSAVGKLKRRELRLNYLQGDYKAGAGAGTDKTAPETGASDSAGTDVHTRVHEILWEILGTEITDDSMTFQECGVVSVNIIELVDKCNDAFGTGIKASEVFGYPVIADFIAHMEELVRAKKQPSSELSGGKTSPASEYNGDIAVVGMSCRFPNGANSAEEYWRLLTDGIDGITEVPKDRWDKDKYYSEDKSEPGKMYCKKGGFLNIPVSDFDAKFFNISPKEAVGLDPHSRMLLELTYEAFENGGMNIAEYNGTKTGVFIGATTGDYPLASVSSGDLSNIDSYSLTGVCESTLCGRISYTFGFRGTCLSVNTACSSALTALHTAVNAIHAGDVDTAVVGGVNLILSPAVSVAFSKLRAVSPNGHSLSFDADADGYARGEGAGVIVIKRLEDAKRDRDNILGVIKATGANQDGHSNGLTAPNGEAQKALIDDTLRRHGLEPHSIGYVEAHGTGTPLGDPIEVNALIDSYCVGRSKNNPLLIGSVKSNIGHLEAASGMAALIKVLLSFEHKMIPANLNFNKPNPQIRWNDAPIRVVAENTEWIRNGAPRRAAVDSFGFGGSNTHVILEEYIPPKQSDKAFAGNGDYFLKISAKTESAVRRLASEYIRVVAETPDSGMGALLATANAGRADYACRAAVSGADKDELIDGLMKVVNEPSSKTKRTQKAAFLFTGQGSQYAGMARGLYEKNPVFRGCMDECDALFRPYLLVSLCELIYGSDTREERINSTEYAQPLIFSVEYALAKTWIEYGIKPELVIGHSIGEFAAAVIAGCMRLETAAELVACRGRLMGAVTEDGAMAAVFAGESVVRELLEGIDGCTVAVYNSEANTVISGKRGQVGLVRERARERGIGTKELAVSNAFHSPLMERAAKDFEFIAKRQKYSAPKLDFISTVYARKLGENEIPDGDYWCDQIMRPVNFLGSVLSIQSPEDYFFLEIGAANTLSMLTDSIFGGRVEAAPSLIKGEDACRSFNAAAVRLYGSGFTFKWESLLGLEGGGWTRLSSLPNYPFERVRYWKELHYDRGASAGPSSDTELHSLLGQRFETAAMEDTVVFGRVYRCDKPFFMGEHIIFNTAIAPAASYVSLIISAMKEIRSPKSITIRNMELREPLIVGEGEAREVQVCIKRAYDRESEFVIASRVRGAKKAAWTVHTKGGVLTDDTEYIGGAADIDIWEKSGYDDEAEAEKQHPVYGAMDSAGFALGNGFKCVAKSRCGDGRGVCVVEPKKNLGYEEEYLIYPGIVDSVFHTMLCVSLADGFSFEGKNTVIPYFITSFGFNYRAFETLWCDSHAGMENNSMMGGTKAYNRRGELVIEIKQMMTKLTTEESLITSRRANRNRYYAENWKKLSEPLAAECAAERVCIITDCKEFFSDAVKLWERSQKETAIFSPEEFETGLSRIFEDIFAQGKKTRFIYGVGLSDEKLNGQCDKEALRLLAGLVREIQTRGLQSLCTVRAVTKYGCNFENGSFNFAQSLLWGFMRGMNMELPEVCAGIIDFDGQAEVGERLAALMLGAEEAEICVRGGEAYCSRLERLSALSESTWESSALPVSGEKTYVIAGGTGALGFHYMKALQKAGARHFAVICRKEPSDGVKERLGRLEENGAQIGLFLGDICDVRQTARIMAQIAEKMPQIGGIVNAAGVIRDKMIRDLSWEDYLFVLEPKVSGSINLYEAAKEFELDFFLLLSSITSVLGNIGQSNYAAANYFENMFASYISSRGINGCAICWGPWLGDGMAGEDNARRNMEAAGIRGFSSEQAALALEEFMGRPYKNLMIADIDWDVFVKNSGNTALWRRLEGLAKKAPVREKRKSNWNVSKISGEELREALKEKLRLICMEAMGYDSAGGIETDVSLMELGADSLMMFSVRSEINELLGADMNVSVLYTYDTIDRLTEYLFEEYLEEHGQDKEEAALSGTEGESVKPKLFIFPYAGGSVYNFAKWKNKLQDSFEVILVEYPGRGVRAREPFASSVEELAGSLIGELKDKLCGEYYLFGHSLGAVVVYEFMLQAKRLGLTMPKKAFLSGREPICFCKIAANTDHMPDMQFMEVMQRYGGIPNEFYRDERLRELFLPVLRADFKLVEKYLYGTHEEKTDCDLIVMYGEGDKNTPANEMDRWQEYTNGSVSLYPFAGTHFYCMEEENAERILELIRSICGRK
ncbi:MAG: SDR family NAD(P)-dependent oxidoreductase [Butyrivibrio sp.]|nr:SDR family NAD(P)-dependent oxidoreductase [Butyrivibrio sp.]